MKTDEDKASSKGKRKIELEVLFKTLFPRREVEGLGSEEIKELIIGSYRESIRPSYDPKYSMFKLLSTRRLNTMEAFFSNIDVTGLDNLADESRHVFMPNHVSHTDYVLLWYILNNHWFSNSGEKKKIKPLSIVAGKNLDNPLLNLVGLELHRLGAVWIDRDFLAGKYGRIEASLYGEAFNREVKRLLENLEMSLIAFPEGGRANGKGVMKRTKNGIFNTVAKTADSELKIAPVALDYTGTVEDPFIPIIESSRPKKNILQRASYYGADALAFLSAYTSGRVRQVLGLSPPDRKVRVSFGEPFYLSECVDGSGRISPKLLAERVAGEVSSLHERIRFRQD